jgi:large subunit ribosomal protein L9
VPADDNKIIVPEKKECVVKVTFLEDVPNIARVGQTRVVADGFARNYLLPRKLAVVADSPAATAAQGKLKKKLKTREIEEAEMKVLAAKIEGTALTIRAKVGEKDKLYGSVTGADIAASLSEAIGREIDKKTVELAEPIRQTGAYPITLRLGHEITASISVKVVSEEATDEEIAALAQPAEKPAAAKPAEKPAKKPRQKKTVEAGVAEAGASIEAAVSSEAAAKPAKKSKEKAPEAATEVEPAEKPAKKPRAKSTKKAKAAEAKAEKNSETGEKASGE